MSASASYPPGTHPADSSRPAAAGATISPVAIHDSVDRSAWWLALISAVLSVVLGVLIVAWPEATLKVVAVLFGLWLLTHGIVRIVQAVTGHDRDAGVRALFGAIGLFFVVAGVVALRNLLVSLALIVTLIGLMWLIGGLMELISAFSGAPGPYRIGNAVLGGLSMIAGIVVLVWPDLSLLTLVYVTGIWMIVMGLVQVVMVVVARGSYATTTVAGRAA